MIFTKQSDKFELNTNDLKSIAMGALIAMAGAFLTYLSETVGNVDFGSYTPLVVAVLSILINAGRKFLIGK